MVFPELDHVTDRLRADLNTVAAKISDAVMVVPRSRLREASDHRRGLPLIVEGLMVPAVRSIGDGTRAADRQNNDGD